MPWQIRQQRGLRFISFLPLVIVLMGVLVFVAVFAVTALALQIALVIAIVAVGLAYSTAMLRRGRRER
jgi:predicted RND superfamily exporter protein